MYFPILRSGSMGQYPVARKTGHGLVTTTTPGGVVWRGRNGAAAEVEWRLSYDELTDDEARALEQHFDAMSGAAGRFTFVDPLANLLRWSEDVSAEGWARGAGLASQAMSDEAGEVYFALSNGGGGEVTLAQAVSLPAGARLCFSCEVRGAASGVEVMAGGERRRASGGAAWRPVHATCQPLGSETAVMAGLALAAGAVVEVRRMQAEMQTAPTPYKASWEFGGIYESTRYGQDRLVVAATGPNRNRAQVRLKSRLESTT